MKTSGFGVSCYRDKMSYLIPSSVLEAITDAQPNFLAALISRILSDCETIPESLHWTRSKRERKGEPLKNASSQIEGYIARISIFAPSTVAPFEPAARIAR